MRAIIAPMRTAPDPARRSERTRSAILAATWELCDTGGYANLTVDAIARRAGVGKQTIYRWWPSKAAVVVDTVLEVLRSRLPSRPRKNLALEIRAQLQATIGVLCDPQLGPRISDLVGAAQHDPALSTQIVEQIVVPMRAVNRALLERAQAQGLVRRDIAPEVAVDLLFAPIWFRFLVSRAPLDLAYGELVLDAAFDGLRPR